MEQNRFKKIEHTAGQIAGRLIMEELSAEDIQNFGIVNITGTKLASDLSYFDVMVSCFKNKSKLPKALAKHGFEIQRKFNKSLDIRKHPKIRFRYDDSGSESSKILETINSLK